MDGDVGVDGDVVGVVGEEAEFVAWVVGVTHDGDGLFGGADEIIHEHQSYVAFYVADDVGFGRQDASERTVVDFEVIHRGLGVSSLDGDDERGAIGGSVDFDLGGVGFAAEQVDTAFAGAEQTDGDLVDPWKG